MTGWDVLVQLNLLLDLSIRFSNAVTKFICFGSCYSRCRYIARIIPDTRPSGSLRSRLVYSWRSRRFFPASPARMTGWDVLVQLTLLLDLSIRFSNAVTKFICFGSCYSRCRYIARIIPDTRPSGSLRSRLVYSWRSRRFFPASPARMTGWDVFVSSATTLSAAFCAYHP